MGKQTINFANIDRIQEEVANTFYGLENGAEEDGPTYYRLTNQKKDESGGTHQRSKTLQTNGLI